MATMAAKPGCTGVEESPAAVVAPLFEGRNYPGAAPIGAQTVKADWDAEEHKGHPDTVHEARRTR